MKCPAGSFDEAATKPDSTYGEAWQDHPSNWQLCKVWKTISPIVDATNISFDKKYPKNRRETPNLNMPLCKPELASLYA